MYDVFISYRWVEPDQSWVREQLAPALEQAGLKVCLDVNDFIPGRDVILEMSRAGVESRCVVCVLSPSYFEDNRAVTFEGLAARRRDPAGQTSSLVPLIVRTTDLPDWIRGLVPVDWTRPKNHGREWRRLLKVLGTSNLEAPPPSAIEAASTESSQGSTGNSSLSALANTVRSEISNSVGAPIQRFRMPQTIAELAILFDWLLDQVNCLENVTNTFGGTRRIHANMWALWPKTIAAIQACDGLSTTERNRLIEFFERGSFNMLMREADYILPRIDEKSYSRDRTLLKRDKYSVQGILRAEIDNLISTNDQKTEFLTLKTSPQSWVFRGFASEEDYVEYLHPTTKTLFTNLSAVQKEMLEEVLDRNEFEEQDLVNLGVKSGEVAETMNALIRDHWLEVVDFSARRFRLTPIGARLLKRRLSVA